MTIDSNLRIQAALYKQMLKSVSDQHGFIEHTKCDSLLFTCLVGCVPGVNPDIEAAFDSTKGQWHRHPNWATHPCYPKHSKSTISRDMLLGLAYYAWVRKRRDIVDTVIDRALSHGMVMGQGALSRTLMTPGLLSTFAWISYKLGGPSRAWLRWIPATDMCPNKSGYQAHLQTLHAHLRCKLTGRGWSELHALAEVYNERNFGWNAYFCLLAGNRAAAKHALTRRFPATRLPNTSDHAAPWLWERDYGDDYQADTSIFPARVHSGGDFLFVYSLLNGDF